MTALDRVRELAEAVARRRSLGIWDVEMKGSPGGSVVRVFVHGDAVDLDTVAEISEEISRGLDLTDPLPGRYTLEVSSPGLERTLRTPEHFARSVGERIVVKTKEVLAGNGHRLEGTVAAVSDESFALEMDGTEVDIPFAQVRSARTVFEWK
ncbi:MAG TPA: ribosome maturation factor RimP [Actinomycetota bacterium]|nr:ribosome maturation factor RimP [Actinomycetota bacterium]